MLADAQQSYLSVETWLLIRFRRSCLCHTLSHDPSLSGANQTPAAAFRHLDLRGPAIDDALERERAAALDLNLAGVAGSRPLFRNKVHAEVAEANTLQPVPLRASSASTLSSGRARPGRTPGRPRSDWPPARARPSRRIPGPHSQAAWSGREVLLNASFPCRRLRAGR